MKHLLRLALLFGVVCRLAASDPARQVLDFNPGWRLFRGDPIGANRPDFDDSGWAAVTLPRAWNEDDAFRVAIDRHATGIAWYRKAFRLPAGPTGGRVFIEFEGVRQAGELWLNGRYLGAHENGVMAFGFDITAALRPAPEINVLAVRTDNRWDYREKLSGARFQWSDKAFNANYGGIPKNVRVHLTGPVYQTLPLYSHLGTTGVYIHASEFDVAGRRARVHAESEVRNEGAEPQRFSLRVTVKDPAGRDVARFGGEETLLAAGDACTVQASARVDGLRFWSWGYGYLYDVTTELVTGGVVIDAVTTRTGFRKTEFGRGVVRLNDRVLHLKGYAQRSSNEWPALGLSVPPWLSDFSNGLMVESGANLVRWMHVTPWKQDVESCDRVGLLQMVPAGDAERDVAGRAWAQRLELMRDAIIYHRNNPSVLVYEAGNKGISEEHMREMRALRDRYDPHGGRAIGSREMLASAASEFGGEMLHVNKSARRPLWAWEYSRDEGLRKYWDELSPPYHKDGDGPPFRGAPAREYNRNQDSHAVENVVRWYEYWRERPGTGERVNAGGLNIIFSDSNTHFRGAENYRRSGEVDAMRLPKDGFYAHQVMWDGWVDVAFPRAHIIGHWNYVAGIKKTVQVVASAEWVELSLNGRKLGRGARSYGFLHTFPDILWEPGRLVAVGYDAAGKALCEAVQETAGEPQALRLGVRTGPRGWRADGADVALVEFEVVDAQGRRCPTAFNQVDFSLEGPAEWRGGLAQGPDNFVLAMSLPVECGVNRVLLRSNAQAGTVKLTARATGLVTAELVLATQPVEVTDGWSRTLAADALQGRLDRGPTPCGSEPPAHRHAIGVRRVTATAGAGPESACDDDETTTWSGRGPISFELEREALLTELTIKVGEFRYRSYPLRVLVDGAEVFRGATPRSLGYVTLALRPKSGRVVTIESVGTNAVGDGFAAIRELADNPQGTMKPRADAQELALTEVEFYERPE